MEEGWDKDSGQAYEGKSRSPPSREYASSYDNSKRDQDRGPRGGGGAYKSRSSDYGRSNDRDGYHSRNEGGSYRSGDNSYGGGERRSNYRGDRDRGDRDRGDRERGGRQYSSGRLSEDMEIERNHVGMVIGRGGSNIREITSKFSVNVNVDKNTNNNGMVSVKVSGNSKSDIDDAISHIKEQCDGYQSRDGDYGSDRNRRRDQTSNDNYRSGNGYSSSSYRNNRAGSPDE